MKYILFVTALFLFSCGNSDEYPTIEKIKEKFPTAEILSNPDANKFLIIENGHKYLMTINDSILITEELK